MQVFALPLRQSYIYLSVVYCSFLFVTLCVILYPKACYFFYLKTLRQNS